MDGVNAGQQPERLEDQLRRMIVGSASNNSTSPNLPSEPLACLRPTVRLPPSGPSQHIRPAQDSPADASRKSLQHPEQRSRISPPNDTFHTRPVPRPEFAQNSHKQRQTQRRMQSESSYGLPFNSWKPPGVPRSDFAPHQRAQYTRWPPSSRLQQQQEQQQLDPNAFHRNGVLRGYHRQPQTPGQLFDPNSASNLPYSVHAEQRRKQAAYLEHIAAIQVPRAEMCQAERDEKEAFRISLQKVIKKVCESDPDLPRVSLECFGSFKSGFASAGSDMDLVIVLQDSYHTLACFSLLEDDLPRRLEKYLLQLGYGARLLTRTRVPIIKICEKPDSCLLDKLRGEREKWDSLPNEKKYPHLHHDDGSAEGDTPADEAKEADRDTPAYRGGSMPTETSRDVNGDGTVGTEDRPLAHDDKTHERQQDPAALPHGIIDSRDSAGHPRRQQSQFWTRERKAGLLDFPKSGVGIQSDINFFNPLGLHNTRLLRCYSACDTRVRPMVLFVKAWAKRRKINSSYSGTLSSYGYVLMVLHYLMNIAQPAVLPNLQLPWRPNPRCTPHGANRTKVDDWVVDFWDNEDEIIDAVQMGQLSSNTESLGSLLAGFFNYFSSQGGIPQFFWMSDVLSLRTPGGQLTKETKGWVKAVTEESEGKKVQHRYLFCIEDPFELAHNVARTVTHKGIVAIRDEFRRANRILYAVGSSREPHDGDLFDQLIETESLQKDTSTHHLNHTGPESYPTTDGPEVEPVPQVKASTNNGSNVNQKMHANKRQFRERPTVSLEQLDLKDHEEFPTLDAARLRKVQQPYSPSGNFVEISGERAQEYLEGLKTRKAEVHAELTATGAAESVLNDDN